MRNYGFEDDLDGLPPKDGVNWFVVVGIVAVVGAVIWWAVNHISGGCLGFTDWFTYCSVTVK